MELRHAVQFQRNGIALKSESAQDVGREVAAVDRQACRARQNRILACSYSYKGICLVVLHIHQCMWG